MTNDLRIYESQQIWDPLERLRKSKISSKKQSQGDEYFFEAKEFASVISHCSPPKPFRFNDATGVRNLLSQLKGRRAVIFYFGHGYGSGGSFAMDLTCDPIPMVAIVTAELESKCRKCFLFMHEIVDLLQPTCSAPLLFFSGACSSGVATSWDVLGRWEQKLQRKYPADSCMSNQWIVKLVCHRTETKEEWRSLTPNENNNNNNIYYDTRVKVHAKECMETFRITFQKIRFPFAFMN